MARRISPERVYQLDIRLAHIDPPIWRRTLVSDQITLAALHHLLQVVLGWERSHLHQFLVGSARYGEPDPEYDDDMARCYVSCYEAQGSGYETCTDGISGESTGPS